MVLRCTAVAALLIATHCAGALAAERRLDERYRATLDFSEQSESYEWSNGPQDVWRLKEFDYALGDKFRVRLGPSQVVFGCHQSNVVWAAIFPDQPGEIVAASQGKGEHVTSVWLRFHPARLGELFPQRIVAGQGEASMLSSAKRLAAHKLSGCWHAGGRVLIPWKKSLNFDIETREGPRRFYWLDTDAGTVQYMDGFRTRSLPVAKPLDAQAAAEAFDKVWNAFDRDYAMFAIKPQVDWAKLRETYRPRAAAAKSNQDLGAVLCEMLDHLEDLHVYVAVDGQHVPGYNRRRDLNANPKAIPRLIGRITQTGHDLSWGRTDDGIGYVNIYRLVDDGLPEAFDEVLGQMGDSKGLILDLRFNGGGSEPLGCQIAGRLLDRARVYSLSQFRNGPKHSDLGPKRERSCGPAGPWHYVGPVVVLQGQKTMSSAESFALALAQCPQVTTLGDRTAGSSGNPRHVDAGAGIVVNLPRWIDLDPQGKPIDAVGIPPRVKIETKPEDFQGDRDPVLTAALANLRSRPKTETAPAGGVLKNRPGFLPPVDRPKVISVFPPPNATDVETATEIRIRFDRPMDPDALGIQTDQEERHDGLRLRKSPRYVAKDREFVIPVQLRPGVRYRLRLMNEKHWHYFWSQEGVAAAPYSWPFATREPAAPSKAPRPRVVSLEPPPGSQTGMLATIQVRFDRPMDPAVYEVAGSSRRTKGDSAPIANLGVSVPFPVQYDAASRCFTFHALLPGNTMSQIELRGFRSADGAEAETVKVEYQVGAGLFRPEQEARIAEAGRSAKLREVVEAVRRNRLAMKSLEATVHTMNRPDERRDQLSWESMVGLNYGRFGFQGEGRFYADVTDIMRVSGFTRSFRLGSDGRECWFFYAGNIPAKRDEVTFCPAQAMKDKRLALGDPFGAARFSSTEKAIEALKLEYLGTVNHDGKTCHRIRSWAGSVVIEDLATGFCDWLIDPQSLLPVVCDSYHSGGATRCEFLYGRINEPLAAGLFQAPASPGITRKPFELEDGYDHFFMKASDGSDGRMSVRWGQQGPKGTSSSGLN